MSFTHLSFGQRLLILLSLFASLSFRPFANSAKIKSDYPQLSRVKYCGNITIYGSEIENQLEKVRQCHVIEGHLRLHRCTLPQGASLPNLTQITDYVILERVEGLKSLSTLFPRLSVIRGQRLFYNNYAFVLHANRHLREVGPWSLRLIVRGSVHIEDNILFCTDEDIQWKNITSLQYRETNVFYNNRQFCPFAGCEEEGTCEARRKSCLSTGLSCASVPERRCHHQCLGGCTLPDNALACVACKNFLFEEEKCTKNCPPTHLKYMNYRCISYERCQQNNWTLFNPDDAKYLGPIESSNEDSKGKSTSKDLQALECVKDCPEKFVQSPPENVKGKNMLRMCKPRPICESSNLTSRNLGDNLRYCSEIEGNLIIRVAGGKNVTRRLEENLRRIKTVSGYVMVVGANALFSFSFLANLMSIQGKETVYGGDSHEGYSFYVLENPNLRQLWDWDFRSRDLKINGSVFIHFNDQLCPSEVEKLRKVTKLPKEKISSDFNGRKSQCNVFHSHLKAVPGSGIGTMKLSWMHTHCGVDDRYVLGYQIFYRPTTENVSLYQERDVCNDKTLWSSKMLKLSDSSDENENECMTYEIEGLFPNTRYAFYVQSLAVDNINNAIQSNIAYNTTYNINPSEPYDGKLELKDSGMWISWKYKPQSSPLQAFASPDDVFFEITIRVEEDHLFDGTQLDEDCEIYNPSSEVDHKDEAEETLTSLLLPKESCSCSSDSENIFLLQQQRKKTIELENEINRLRFYRKILEENKDVSHETSHNGNNNSTYQELKNYRERACARMKALPNDCREPSVDWTNSPLKFDRKIYPSPWKRDEKSVFTINEKTSSSSVYLPLPTDYDMGAEPTRTVVRVRACVGEIVPCTPLNISTPCALCSSFHKWMKYAVESKTLPNFEVIAWLKETKENGEEKTQVENYIDCKQPASSQVSERIGTKLWSDIEELLHVTDDDSNIDQNYDNRTGYDENRNRSTVEREITNKPILKMSWDVPQNLEIVTLGYRILYHRIDISEKHTLQVCLPKKEADKRGNNFKLPVLSGKKYWVGIQILTLAGYGPVTGKCILVPRKQTTDLLIHFAWFAVGIAGLLMFLVVYKIWKGLWKRLCKRSAKNETYNRNYGVTWLRDIQEKYRLPPNQLYINTNRILGAGKFGMVYEGTITKDNDPEILVAVKTIKEDESNLPENYENMPKQSREDKLEEFLKEIIIMQGLDSFFILNLVAVTENALGLMTSREPSLFAALEYMDKGDLKTFLLSTDELLIEQQMVEMAAQVADGMAYLSSQNFLHRDLAARNCMLNSNMTVKVGDFGFTRYLKTDYYYYRKQNKMLPVRWTAPEILINGKYNSRSDVWSFGVLLFEIVTQGKEPYKRYSNEQVLSKVSAGELKLECPSDRSQFLSSLVKECHQWKPRKRPSFLQLVEVLLPRTSESFRKSFLEKSYFRSPGCCDSESTEGCDEGCFAGSSLDASQDDNDLAASTLGTFQPCDEDDAEIEDDNVCLTPKEGGRERSSCLSLTCVHKGLSCGRKRFSISDDALLFQ